MKSSILGVMVFFLTSLAWAQEVPSELSEERQQLLGQWSLAEEWAKWIGYLCLSEEQIEKQMPTTGLKTSQDLKIQAQMYIENLYNSIYGTNVELAELLTKANQNIIAEVPKLQEKSVATYRTCQIMPQIYLSYQSFMVGGRQCVDVYGQVISTDIFSTILNECAIFNYQVDAINKKISESGFNLNKLL